MQVLLQPKYEQIDAPEFACGTGGKGNVQH